MDADPSSYEARELNWQIYTRAGNQQMQGQFYAQAQQTYSRAMEFAELLLAEAKSNSTHPDAIHPYVVSHNNLADAYGQLGNIEQAEATLQRAYTEVTAVMNDPNLSKSLRLESFKALKVVAFELTRFYRNLNQPTAAEMLFAQITQQAQAFLAEFDFTSLEELKSNDSIHSRYSSLD
ncbi:MAG: tetratricopeptide repeat protein [Synechococcales cyanobacterium M58_A2018_015]|nr:tetratricopeptide repeat protein [Synechococcales cyanobacterium M58_A2018_015]